MPDAFYEPDDAAFASTTLTRGPWDPTAQHGGPPAALLGRSIERCEPHDHFRVARITLEILRPVPIEPLTATAKLVRPGKRVEYLEARLTTASDVEVMRAAAWRIRAVEDTVADVTPPVPAPPPPEDGEVPPFFDIDLDEHYGTAVEWRFVKGAFRELGPASAWLRMTVPLIAGEEPTPLQRTLVAADAGNGISAAIDYGKYIFINTDLTVHMTRTPAGEWINLNSVTTVEPVGIGVTDTVLSDREGRVGRATQTLLVAPR